MQEMAGMAGLVGAATAGQFAVDHASGEQMILSIGRMRTQLNDVMTKLRALTSEQTPLGTLPEAQHVARQNQLVAAGDQQSAAYVLARFAEALEHAETAVRQGMANYDEVEAAAERSFEQREAEKREREAQMREHRHGGMRAV
jgi:hypothetical protein